MTEEKLYTVTYRVTKTKQFQTNNLETIVKLIGEKNNPEIISIDNTYFKNI